MPMLYVVRHAQSLDNVNHIFSGWRDSPLAPEGVAMAKTLAQRLKNKKIDLAFSSDQVRALKTAQEILKFHKGVPIIVDARLRERNYGTLTGKSKIAFQLNNPKKYAMYHRSYVIAPPDGESFRMVNVRVEPFIKDLLTIMRHWGVNVLISAHGNSIRPFRKHFERLSIRQARTLENAHDKILAYRV